MEMVSDLNFFTVEETQPEENPFFRKRIGILGGTFNPPHLGHLNIAQQAGHQLGLDQVFFMPDAEPPHIDSKPSIPSKHRKKMVEQSIKGNDLFALETMELERGGKSYTVDTMKELTEKNPNTDYYFIIGADMVEYLPKWERIDELLSYVHFVGVGRPGYEGESVYPIIWVDSPSLDISSTSLRKMVQAGQSIRYLVSESVEEYIEKEGLYLD